MTDETHENRKGCKQEEMPPLTKDSDFHELGWFTEPSLIDLRRFSVTPVRPPTVCVSCGGWEGGLALETGKCSKPGKCPKNAGPTHRQLHALLGALTERTTPSPKDDTTARLTKLLHTIQTFSTDKKHDLPEPRQAKYLTLSTINLTRATKLD
jgi:hypothetical protein